MRRGALEARRHGHASSCVRRGAYKHEPVEQLGIDSSGFSEDLVRDTLRVTSEEQATKNASFYPQHLITPILGVTKPPNQRPTVFEHLESHFILLSYFGVIV
jgi:hypothetical protein